jgi:hypothetical protein
MRRTAAGLRLADHLTGGIDRPGAAAGATESTQVRQPVPAGEKGVLCPEVRGSPSDDLTRVIDPIRNAHLSPQRPQVFHLAATVKERVAIDLAPRQFRAAW